MSEGKNKKHTVTSQVNIQLNSVKSKTSTKTVQAVKKVFQENKQITSSSEHVANVSNTNEPATTSSNTTQASSNEDASWYSGRRRSSINISSKKIPLAPKKSRVSNAVSFYEGSPTDNGSNKTRASGQEQKGTVRFRRNSNYDKLLSKFSNNSQVSFVIAYLH